MEVVQFKNYRPLNEVLNYGAVIKFMYELNQTRQTRY